MLLGAGASQSSGVRTGQDLVSEWREIFLKKIKDVNSIELTLDEKKELLAQQYSWYKKENEYSSFFGKIYDLPNQRRNFIELEVNDKEPSIGYHYLNRLAASGNIETFFTTNFDDLLEQAFVDIKRPIVCPHDSSVKNISVTSRRTKIIKLHGDFLFNTLKSTEDEVNDLNKNMKNKFEEFLKNYGLIVVGYAGYDNSIMSVLNELVSSPDYLNNGIYWCIRKEDFEKEKISPSLYDLLKKDKVYHILIDNFDSFCAELAHLVIGDDISLGATHLSQLENRQKFFIAQKEQFSNDKLITNDINECLSSPPFNDQSNYEIEEDFNPAKEKNNFKIIKKDKQQMFETLEGRHIYELIWNKEYNKAIEIIDKKISDLNLPSFQYNRFLNMKIQCYLKLKQRKEALKVINDLILYNETNRKDSNVPLLLQKADITPLINDKIQILEKALQLDCNNIETINFLAETKSSTVKYNPSVYKSVIDLYDRSISLQPISSNDAYLNKLSFIKDYTSENKKDSVINICNQIIHDLDQKDYYSICVYDAKIEKFYQEAKYSSNKKEYLNNMKDLFYEYYNGNCVYERNELYLHEYINKLSKLHENEELKQVFLDFDLENRQNIAYYLQKADIALCNFRNLDQAIKIMESVDKDLIKLKDRWRIKYFARYFEYLLYKKEYSKICSIVENEPDSKILANINSYTEALFYVDQSKYFDIIYKDFEESEKLTTNYVTLTYNLLKLGMYDDIYEICQDLFHNQTKNENVDINHDVLRINYNLAKKRLNKAITKSNLEYIFHQKNDSVEKAASYILIDKVDEAMKILQKEIEKDYQNYYYLQVMPVFDNIDFEKLKLMQLEFKN